MLFSCLNGCWNQVYGFTRERLCWYWPGHSRFCNVDRLGRRGYWFSNCIHKLLICTLISLLPSSISLDNLFLLPEKMADWAIISFIFSQAWMNLLFSNHFSMTFLFRFITIQRWVVNGTWLLLRAVWDNLTNLWFNHFI